MRTRIIKKVLASFVILAFILTPLRLDFLFFKIAKAIEITDENKWTDYDNFIVIDHDEIWSGNKIFNNPDKPVVIVDGATVTIEKGTRIELTQMYVYFGRIVAEGTAQEKITFTRATPDLSQYPGDFKPECFRGENGVIEFNDWAWYEGMESSFMRYVEFSNMGTYKKIDTEICPAGIGINTQKKNNFFNRAYAQGSDRPDVINPALRFRAGRLNIENSSFVNNSFADIESELDSYEGEPDSYLNVTNSNFSGNLQNTALISNAWKRMEDNTESEHRNDLVKLKNNWYGSSSGPRTAPDYLLGGEIIKGDYTLSGFRTSDFIADPVIILPGIMGSMPKYGVAGELKLEPITQLYSNLVASLEENRYTKNLNLFEFPYEWRNSNVISAEKLKDKITEVKNETGASRVDLVAHSMGGLVSRYYIESALYQNDVDQLVTLGTPHKGSPKSYPRWEAAEGFFSKEEQFAKFIFTQEAHIYGYDTLKEYIQQRIKSVQELLPDYDYLYDVAKKEMRDYPEGYPENTFLEYLNGGGRLANLEAVNFVNIVGKTSNDKSTTSGFRVVASPEWEHGIPENFYDANTDQGMEYDEGDQTVPLSSAIGIPSDKKIELENSHNDLPTEAQCYVFKELSGKETCEFINTFKRVKSLLTFGVFSPIDIQVVDPNGKRVGKDFETGEIFEEIPGAYYTGYDTDAEFLTIPNPEDGEYKILTEGVGDGEYKVEVSKISEDPSDPEKAIESTVAISGTASVGQEEEKAVTVSGNEVTITENGGGDEKITIAVLRDNLEKYIKDGKIPRKADQMFLRASFRTLEKLLQKLEQIKNNPKINKKIKPRMVANFEKQINRYIDLIIRQIQRNHKKNSIAPEIRDSLIRGLEAVRPLG